MRGGQAFRASARRAVDLPPRWAEGRARAAVGPFPFAEHRTLAEVDALPEPVVFTPERLARSVSTLLDTNGEKAKPRIKPGATKSRAKARVEAAGHGEPAVERVSRPAAGRSAAATSELGDVALLPYSPQPRMDVTAGETATDISEPSPLAAPTPVVKRPAGEKTPLASSPPAIIKRASLPKAERLALPVESGMEQLFTRVTVGPIGGAMAEAAAVDDGKTWCGPCDYRVPRWFGRNCISGQCPLKGKGG